MFGPYALAALIFAPAGPQEVMGEYQALANVMRHFLALVSWPPPTDRPLRLVVIGGMGFGTELDAALSRSTVGGRKVVVRYLQVAAFLSDPQDCDAVFIDRGEEERLPNILARTRGRPILTMAFGEDLARRGVMVNFHLENRRIRFDVNPTKLREVNLGISSHLLSMAKVVE